MSRPGFGSQMLSLALAIAVVGGAAFGAIKLLEAPRNAAADGAAGALAGARRPAAASGVRPGNAPAAASSMASGANAGHAGVNPSAAVYRCDKDGRTVYADELCPGVPSSLVELQPTQGFEPPQELQDPSQPQRESPAPQVSESTAPADAVSSNRSVCAALDAEITNIDAITRSRGMTIPELDYWREKRAEVVNRRFALKCHLLAK